MIYEGDVYRPPSEAGSLIIQATIGCSHNKCTFCNMYKADNFRIKSVEHVISDLEYMAVNYSYARRIFLADGDALIMKIAHLEEILLKIKELYPACKRVGIYASPASIFSKSPEELSRLAELGIGIGYIGLETGSDRLLKSINKGFNSEQIIRAAKMLKVAGIKSSITVISGLGGQEFWEEHAVETGRVLSEMKVDYIGLLTLRIEPGTPMDEDYRTGKIKLLGPLEIARETWLMLNNIDSEGSIFRSNHASNYFSLSGTLNADKPALLAQIEAAMQNKIRFRPEQLRYL